MRAAPPTLDYEHRRPLDLPTRLERRGRRLRTAGRWCLAVAAIAVAIAGTSLVGLFVVAYVWPELGDSDYVGGFMFFSIFLPFVFALFAYPAGVILQSFGDAYRERAEVLTRPSEP